tara:strand:- start:470 stop:1501 length:1032 start_codon:yes stop_codon:yes gene_type:complete
MTSNQDRFKMLFEGFPYAYGLDSGGCAWQSMDYQKFNDHLQGREKVGIYPMVYDPEKESYGPAGFSDSGGRPVYPDMQPELWKCKWGSIDIDELEESQIHAQNAVTLFAALDIKAWMEISRSKGYHVWVFAREWTCAATMRKALLAVTQLGDLAFDAVYPKQDSLLGPPGNYMRLPYGNTYNTVLDRQVMVDSVGVEIHWDEFAREAYDKRTEATALEAVAALWKPPVNAMPPARSYDKKPLMKMDGNRLRGIPRRMFEDGPADYYRSGHGAGRGRHGFLNRFARAMWEAGYDQSDVISWTSKLDSHLGSWFSEGPKFEGRHDAQRQIENVAHQARNIAVFTR